MCHDEPMVSIDKSGTEIEFPFFVRPASVRGSLSLPLRPNDEGHIDDHAFFFDGNV
jgi:hypothetical protein